MANRVGSVKSAQMCKHKSLNQIGNGQGKFSKASCTGNNQSDFLLNQIIYNDSPEAEILICIYGSLYVFGFDFDRNKMPLRHQPGFLEMAEPDNPS